VTGMATMPTSVRERMSHSKEPESPRLLFIGAGDLSRPNGGHLRRQSMFLDALRRCGRVTAVLVGGQQPRERTEPDGTRLVTLPAVYPKRQSRRRQFLADLFSPLPRLHRAAPDLVPAMSERGIDPRQFDLVLAYRFDFARWAGVLDLDHLLLDIDDPEHVRQARAAELHGRPDWRTRRDLVKLRRFERKHAARARLTFVCQEGDAARFSPLPLVIPNAVAVGSSCPPRRVTEARLMLLGNFAGRSTANVDGLAWFVAKVWPAVLDRNGDVELHIVGEIGDHVRKLAARTSGIVLRGFVDDLTPEFAAAAASIVPIRFGTGTRVKILDSLAHGCPVVTTTMGCDGLGLTHGREALIADEPTSFAVACIELIDDTEKQARLASYGWQLVVDRFSRDTNVDRIHQVIVEMVGYSSKATSR